jgi:RNA polymerase sigma factor (sigma-70 family)
MTTSRASEALDRLRRSMLPHGGAEPTDGQLLQAFVRRRDEAAVAALVRRHGPMVWGVCRRALHNPHDAEDAFQATFLVLVRRAGAIAAPELVANWLYGVARRTARKARAAALRRRRRETPVANLPDPPAPERDPADDLRPVLDREVSRLPAGYRAVLVLCDLEGRTRRDAARHLGLPEGTVGSRLARARALLAGRLARHGLAVSGGALAAALAREAASAGVPAAVAASTVRAAAAVAAGRAAAGVVSAQAAALAEGVVRTMWVTKLKVATAVVLAVGLTTTAGTGLALRTAAGEPGGEVPGPKRVETPGGTPPGEKDRAMTDIERLQGAWTVVSCQVNEREQAGETGRTFTFRGNTLVTKGPPETDRSDGRLFEVERLDPARDPKEIDLRSPFEVNQDLRGVYELDGDRLTVCLAPFRPKALASPKDGPKGVRLYVLRRDKATTAPARGTDSPAAAADRKKLQGLWVVGSCRAKGQEVKGQKGRRVEVVSNSVWFLDNDAREGRFFEVRSLDPAKDPKEITLLAVGGTGEDLYGLYQFDGDRLTLCLAPGKRPAALAAPADGPAGTRLYVLRRETGDGPPASVGMGPVKVTDEELVQGHWSVFKVRINGPHALDETEAREVHLANGSLTIRYKERTESMRYKVDPAKDPKEIDLIPTDPASVVRNEVYKGIYKLGSDELVIAFTKNQAAGAARPANFDGSERGERVYTLKRRNPPDAQGRYFGPVLERAVTSGGDKASSRLDLDTGLYVERGAAGADIADSPALSDTRARVGVDLVAVPVPDEKFESAIPADVAARVAAAAKPAGRGVSQLGGKDRTYYFQTAGGNTGVLQVLPREKGSDAVTVRYKLVYTDEKAKD